MLPTAHVEYTWAVLNLLQRRTRLLARADYRWVALAACASDLLDKPLALTLYRQEDAALFWGHNLWLHAAVWGLAATLGGSKFKRALPYLLAFSGHLLADRMWGFQESLFYPLGAGRWHPWVHVGEPSAMWQAYLSIIRSTPLLVAFEAGGLALLGWLAWDRQLWRPGALARLLRTGRVDEAGWPPELRPSQPAPALVGRAGE